VAEGGTFPIVSDSTHVYVTGIVCAGIGATWQWTSANGGRWYYVWQLENGAGWSLWTDGNTTPSNVMQFVTTTSAATADSGPPLNWNVNLAQGPTSNTVVCSATRPATNGKLLADWVVQIRDASTGSWRLLDANAGAAVTHLDATGGAYPVTYDGAATLTSTNGWPANTVVPGDIVLVDTRGGAFNVEYCVGGNVESITANTITITSPLAPLPQVYTNLWIKCVVGPWLWTTEGYLGAQPNNGLWTANMDPSTAIYGDTTTQTFTSPPIEVPSGIVQPEARVWFSNFYSVSDNNLTHSTGLTGGTGVFGPRTFTNFADLTYFLPVVPEIDTYSNAWGTMTFNSSNQLVITGGTALQQYGTQFTGVKGRFRVYPDLTTGTIEFLLTFGSISAPQPGVGTLSSMGQYWGMMFANASGYDSGAHLVVNPTYGGGVNSIAGTAGNFNSLMPIVNASPSVNLPSGTHPATSLQLQVTYTVLQAGVEWFTVEQVQYNVDGGGLTAISGTYNTDQMMKSGLQPYLGVVANGRSPVTGTITSFQMIHGLGVME
jgi:hypothetical protein